jgi:thiol:disulfide interchange protein DsbC
MNLMFCKIVIIIKEIKLKIKKLLITILISIMMINSYADGKLLNTFQIQSIVTKNFTPILIDNKEINTYFHRLLPTTTINSIYTTPYPDTYALVIGVNLVYGNLHSSYLMVGHLFNVYTQDDITTQLQKQTTPKIDITKINIADAVVEKSPKNVHKKLIIFIDPDCPYCRQLEQQIFRQNLNNKADIYYMMMPLSIHPTARTHATNILCSMNQISTLQEYMINNNNNPDVKLISDCNIDPVLERISSNARLLSINATPIVITGDGGMIMGDDIDSINNYLNK